MEISYKINKRMLLNEHYKDDMIYITQLTRNVLSTLGVWPSYNRKRSLGEKIWKYFLISISYILLCCVLIPGAFFWLIEKRTRVRIQMIPLLLYGFMACSKYGNLIFREKNIRRCLKHIEEDWRTVNSVTAREIMIQSANVGRLLVTICAVFMYGSGLSFRLILPFARGKITNAQNITMRPLACPAYFFSIDVQVSPVYEFIFVIQVLSGIVTFSITTGLYGLASIFVMHTCGQLRILIDLMRNIVEEKWQEKQEVNRNLVKMVKHQIRIRSFLQLVENTLQQACLAELMGSTVILCILGYLIIMEWENNNRIAMCSYFTSISCGMVNLFIFCYIGEQLTVQAEKVAKTSCELEWYRLPNKEARGIVLIVIMSNMPAKITAGNVIDLSFKTYGDIMKTVVTYFNMLLNTID